MTAKPLVSVIVPVHNGRRFLGQALDSILAQDHEPIEAVVVDDGSTDGTAEIARARGMRCLSQDRQGAAAALNAGIAAARGSLIAFLDHDDVLPPHGISTRVRALAGRPELGYVQGLLEIFLEPGTEWHDRFDRREWDEPRPLPTPGAMLVRREVFDTVGVFDTTYSIAYDVDWMVRTRRAGIAHELIQEPVLRYRLHETNMTRDRAVSQSEVFRALRAAGDTRVPAGREADGG